MKKELDDLLCERYPAIFAERRLPKSETCMCWGFDCGDGWFSLIDTLCASLQFETEHNKAPQVVTRQVKEKKGQLQFYANGNDYQAGMIAFASAMSRRICEECGQPGELLVRPGGVQMVRCPVHMPKEAVSYGEYIRRNGPAALAP